jgi:fructose-bisphosphate aldolase class II
MGQTYGVPVSEIVEGIKNGVRKVNIDTDLRMASTGAIRKHLAEDRKNFDPRKFFKEATKAMKGICQDRYEAFGAGGMASKITKVYSLGRHAKALRQGRTWPLAWPDVLSIIGAQRRRDLSLVLT